ncbi:MAG: carbohydrate-binding domain-containing protein [Treponema sp.]|nr:carbohydrate-binding domain-containing protein [Treponema sp.]
MVFFFSACVVEADDDFSSSVSTQASGSSFSASKRLYINLTNRTVSADNATFTTIQDTESFFLNNTVAVSLLDSVVIKIDATNITENLAVNFEGTLSTGGVKIQTTTDHEIGVYLNNVSITSSNYPCFDITKGGSASVFLTGTNSLVDGRTYGYGYGSEYASTSQNPVSDGSDSKGTLYCKGGLSLSGSGSLSVVQAYKNCIASKDGTLTIESGTYTLANYKKSTYAPLTDYSSTSATGKNGLFGGRAVVINGGDITFYGNGLVSSSECRKANGIKTDDDDYPSSSVTITGGKLSITTYNGKGIAAPYVYIKGGSNTINVRGTTSYTGDSAGGMRAMGGFGGGNAPGASSTNSGGTSTSGSWYDADGVKESGTITFAAEGIEGVYRVEISGGTTEVTATDDGINVSGSSASFVLSGGSVYTYSLSGDGIDSNGSISVSGGTAVSYAPTGSEDSFDSDGKITISGGTIAGVSGSQMALSEYSTSGQKLLYFTGGSLGSVAVSLSGSLAYAFELPSSSYGLFVMSSPRFTSSSASSYTVYSSPTFSGGTDFHGLYTTLPTVSDGSSTKTPSIK